MDESKIDSVNTDISSEEETATKSGKLFDSIVEDGVVKSEYRLSDIEDYMKRIDELSFIECAGNLREVNSTIFSIQNLKGMLDGFRDNSGNDDESVGKEIALNNIVEQSMEESGLNAKEFYANYDHNIEVLKAMKKALTAKVDEARAHNSAKYINDEMVAVLEKRIARLKESDNINKDYLLKRFNHVLEAFKERINWKWIHSKACVMIENKRTMKILTKSMQSYSISTLKGLCKFSSEDELKEVERTIAILVSDIKLAQCVMVVLNKISLSEEKSGYDSYVKTIILNLLDAKSGIFDLCENPNDYFDHLAQSLTIIGWSMMIRIDSSYQINQKAWAVIDEYTSSCQIFEGEEPIIYHHLKLKDSFIEDKLPNGNVPCEWVIDYIAALTQNTTKSTLNAEVKMKSTSNNTLLDEHNPKPNNEGEN